MIPGSLDSLHTDEMAALLAVESEGSFVAAGRLLQRHPSVVSKRVAAMEKRLGVRLVERSTRRVRITSAGARLVERLRDALGAIVEAEQEAASDASEVRGVLRLALPAAMGRLWLAPMLPEFLAAYPEVSVVAEYSERYVDLIAEGYDAAIRVGELNDSRLIAKKLGDHRRILCASPDYLERRGIPTEPYALAEHNCLCFSGFNAFPEWHLFNGRRKEAVAVTGTLTANDGESLLAAALAGIGVLGSGEWLVSREIEAGRLVRVLPDWTLDADGGIYLVRPSAKYSPASTLAFKAWIESRFAAGTPWPSVE